MSRAVILRIEKHFTWIYLGVVVVDLSELSTNYVWQMDQHHAQLFHAGALLFLKQEIMMAQN